MQKLSQTDELAGQLASQARSHLLTEEQVSQAMDQQEYDVSQLDALYEALAARGVRVVEDRAGSSGAGRGTDRRLWPGNCLPKEWRWKTRCGLT